MCQQYDADGDSLNDCVDAVVDLGTDDDGNRLTDGEPTRTSDGELIPTWIRVFDLKDDVGELVALVSLPSSDEVELSGNRRSSGVTVQYVPNSALSGDQKDSAIVPGKVVLF